MRPSLIKCAAAVASMMLVPQLAAASDVEAQLQQMQERMSQMEERLQATQDELETANTKVNEQQAVIREAGLEESEGNALSSFLQDTDFYGWVNTSYTVNLRGEHNDNLIGQNSGQFGGDTMPFHADSNSFKVNQAWFGMDKTPTEDSRAGYHIDILFGADALLVGGAIDAGNANSVALYTANASYMFPVLDGLTVTGGKFATIVGTEVVESPYNFNITRGIQWSNQPVTHTGATANLAIGNFNVLLGAANNNALDFGNTGGATTGGFSAGSYGTQFDTNWGKGFLAQVGWSNDKYGVALNYIMGKNNGSATPGCPTATVNCDYQWASILDFVVSADPIENLSLWFNFDWINREATKGVFNTALPAGGSPVPGAGIGDASTNMFIFGLAGRYAVTDKAGISLRGEYAFDNNGAFLNAPYGSGSFDTQRWSVTVTGDYSITENLMFRTEFRYDGAQIDNGASNNSFCGSGFNPGGGGCAFRHNDQFAILADMTYQF